MALRLAAALVALATLWLALRWLAKAQPRRVLHAFQAAGLAALVALGLWLMLTGRLAGIVAVVAGLAPWAVRVLRLHALWQAFRGVRRAAPPPPRPPAAGLSREEARQILGVGPRATAAEIKAAHRRLMRTAHPDHGGSSWIAARLNAARDLLLSGE